MGFETRNKVTPQGGLGGMTDIVFLLLFFFVILSLFTVTGENVDLPQSTKTTTIQTPPATITITAENTLQLNNKPITQAEIPAKLNAMFFNKPDEEKKVIINGDKSADWGIGMEIMTAVNDIGFKVSVAMKPGRQ